MRARAIFVLVAALSGCGPAAETCPRTSYRDYLRLHDRQGVPEPDPEECARKLAKAVCHWDASEHEARLQLMKDREAEDREAEPRGVFILREEHHVRCGCAVEPVGACFLRTHGKRVGDDRVTFYVATGAPGCERVTEPRGRPDPGDVVVSGARCGAIGIARSIGTERAIP